MRRVDAAARLQDEEMMQRALLASSPSRSFRLDDGEEDEEELDDERVQLDISVHSDEELDDDEPDDFDDDWSEA